MQISSIKPIDRALSGATTPGQSGPGSNSNEGVLHILQSSSITGTSPSDCLVPYSGHSWGGLTPLQKCSRCILQPQPTEQYTELNIKSFSFQIIQFSLRMQFRYQNSSILSNSF